MSESKATALVVFASAFSVTLFIAMLMYVIPIYRVWSQGMTGEAELRRAEFNRQIAVREAQATRESAVLLAEAEVERARGVAEANVIIGDSLQGNDAYLRYRWIEGVHSGENTIIYIPTEGGLPILEASRTPLGEETP